jgi:hypothetical protein
LAEVCAAHKTSLMNIGANWRYPEIDAAAELLWA